MPTYATDLAGLLDDEHTCPGGLARLLFDLTECPGDVLPWWVDDAVLMARFCLQLDEMADRELPAHFIELPWDALCGPVVGMAKHPHLSRLGGHLRRLRRPQLARVIAERPDWLLVRYAPAVADQPTDIIGQGSLVYWLQRGALPWIGPEDPHDEFDDLLAIVDRALDQVSRARAHDPLVAVFLREDTGHDTAHHTPPVATLDQVRVLALPTSLARGVRGNRAGARHSRRSVQVHDLPDGWQHRTDRLHTTLALWSDDPESPLFDVARAWETAAAVRGPGGGT